MPCCLLTGLKPTDIDILVTTCSIFCPTPSMASMLVNAFSMRPDIQSYHLGGMGCSNGVVAVNLIKDLLKVRERSHKSGPSGRFCVQLGCALQGCTRGW